MMRGIKQFLCFYVNISIRIFDRVLLLIIDLSFCVIAETRMYCLAEGDCIVIFWIQTIHTSVDIKMINIDFTCNNLDELKKAIFIINVVVCKHLQYVILRLKHTRWVGQTSGELAC